MRDSSLPHPKFALPAHGKYRHRKAQAEVAKAVGVSKGNILFVSTGDVVTLTADSCKTVGHAQTGGILTDSFGVSGVGNVVLRDRQNLAQNGIMIVIIGPWRGSDQLLAGPEIVLRGSAYVKDSEDLMAEARERAVTAVTDSLDASVNDWSRLKNAMRNEPSDFFWRKTKRTPVIPPTILDVN